MDEDFLNDTLRDQLQNDANGIRSVIVSAIIDHVHAFHSNAEGLPFGNDAHQYLRYALTLDRSSRVIQNMLLKYHSANNDMDEYIRTIMQRHGPEMEEIERADPPLDWGAIKNAVDDSILIGSAVATRRAPPSNDDLSEAAAYWSAGADEYERFLQANPSEARRREHRDRYTYLRLLAAQSLFTAGDLQDLRDSVLSVDRVSSFYADAISGNLHLIKPADRLMVVQNVNGDLNSQATGGDREGGAQAEEGNLRDPALGGRSSDRIGVRVYRLPESASFASPAQILVLQHEDVPETCVVSDLLVHDPNPAPIILGCRDGSVFLGPDPQSLSEILSPQTVRENPRTSGRRGAWFIKSADTKILAAVTNAAGRVIAAEEINKEGIVESLSNDLVGSLDARWYLATQKRSTDSRTDENIGLIRRTGSGVPKRRFEVFDARSGEMHAYLIDENVNISRVGIISGEEPGSLFLASYTDEEWVIYGTEGRLGSLDRHPRDELFSTASGLLVRVSVEGGAGEVETFLASEKGLKPLACGACKFAPPPETGDGMAAVSAVWRGNSGFVAAETATGIVVYSLSRAEQQISPKSPSGPPGQPLYAVTGMNTGLLIGPSDAGEVTSWRFESLLGAPPGQ
ncbi:hypothetical protein [Paracoccus sphaerophysae]|uniref:hypothetical protein n=1 Tax=Paracoccus sphaerophysae TaxID=690417 RepID=UPI0012EB9294|nr:hypothetical protein [Paracoccus sphaerophysae]